MGGWIPPGSIPGAGHLSRYVFSYPVQLSLAVLSWESAVSTSQTAVTPCGWGVKAGTVRVWVVGKTGWSPCYTRAIYERLSDKGLIYKALYIFICLFFTLFCYVIARDNINNIINILKTKEIVFRRPNPRLYINPVPISEVQQVTSAKLLGITLCDTLRFDAHIGNQCCAKYFLKVFKIQSMNTCWKKYLKYSEKYKYWESI